MIDICLLEPKFTCLNQEEYLSTQSTHTHTHTPKMRYKMEQQTKEDDDKSVLKNRRHYNWSSNKWILVSKQQNSIRLFFPFRTHSLWNTVHFYYLLGVKRKKIMSQTNIERWYNNIPRKKRANFFSVPLLYISLLENYN